MPKISIIVAADENNAIGKDNGMLCHLPDDLKYFKKITSNYPVIMGRKTFESLPKGALPNRRNIVITRNRDLSFKNCEMCPSIESALLLCKEDIQVFIMGGGMIYKEAMDIAGKLYLTRIHNSFTEADTYFPNVNTKEWKEIEKEHHPSDEKHKFAFTFLVYEKIKA